MKFEILTFLDNSFGFNSNKNLKLIQNECYPDDWCKPQSGSGCCPGPEGCYPAKCTPDRDGDYSPKSYNSDN